MQSVERSKERIKKMFDKIELSVSSYDTAWVAMVPSPDLPHAPLFPGCLKWLLDNQLNDGSWGLLHRDPSLTKDALSSTLASILALKRWGVGEGHVKKGLHFIESNFRSINDEKQHSPIGFDIIFPGMVEYARDMDLVLPLTSSDLDTIFWYRDLELERCYRSNSNGSKAYLASLSEAMGGLSNWKTIMNYQRKNGSLFNSPSTTAAALIHLHDTNCLNYLQMLLKKYEDGVPTIYPLDVYTRLQMVENLQKMGIDRQWLQGDEEIVLDLTTCALAFQLLRTSGYDVSSDLLTRFVEKDQYLDSLKGQYKDDTTIVLELFKASQLVIYPNETALEEQNAWSRQFLQQKLSGRSIKDGNLSKQVINALTFPYHASLDRIVNKAYLRDYKEDEVKVAKTSYCCPNISNKDFKNLGVIDFNMCQSLHQEEIKQLERWEREFRLDRLKFTRRKLVTCALSAAAMLFTPELSNARISWIKHAVLAYVVDDFFDVGSSQQEKDNLIHLLDKWDMDEDTKFCSEAVEIIFLVLQDTICESAGMALKWQGRCVKAHLIQTWMDLLKSMGKEAEWVRDKVVPPMDEYMENGYVSLALGPIVLPTLYLVGPRLSEEIVASPEYHRLYKLMSTCGRLLNDIQTYERESKEGKLNAVPLHIIHRGGIITEQDSIKELREIIGENAKKLLRMILETKDSVVPRACKDLFWDMTQVHYLFYSKVDGFSSPTEMETAINEVLYMPIDCNEMKIE
ncbi:Terpene synthase, metal-binding domain [Dillenia turbinata]|uniref:Terpene synthase, metal-binding domain n=1 Tax=Dillenia turbinata TaxID=194707 RepID=A0AAN8ZE37_9MAGN